MSAFATAFDLDDGAGDPQDNPSPTAPTLLASPGAAQPGELASLSSPPRSGVTAAVDFTADELREAQARADLCQRYLDLVALDHTGREAASSLGVSQSRFSGPGNWLDRWRAGGVGALVERRESPAGRIVRTAADLGLTPEQTSAAVMRLRALWIQSNATWNRGSLADAATRYASEPDCPEPLRTLVRDRLKRGRVALPPWLARQVTSAEPIVRASRAPRDAYLAYCQAPGSIQLCYDPATGAERRVRPGEWWTIDDGTLNFAATVPLEFHGNKCSDKFGVLVGRFQLLLMADHASYFLPGFSYTARPASSYRAEDLLATMHTGFIQHGVPGLGMVLERGISAAHSIRDALGGVGCQIWRAQTPHLKVVEFIFNWLWTRLSHVPGQLGRYGGDHTDTFRLYQACRDGREDPRLHFWDIAKVAKAIGEAVTGWNAHTVHSDQYGSWVPAERWIRESAAQLRPLDASTAWLFAPHVTGPLKVTAACISTSVRMMDGLSVRFSFQSSRLMDVFGATVKLHFNPFGPDADAMVTLAEPWQGLRAGTVLGPAIQINRLCGHSRRAMLYGDDLDRGRRNLREQGQALRRAVVSIRADGTVGHQVVEARDGTGNAARMETAGEHLSAIGDRSSVISPQTSDLSPRTADIGSIRPIRPTPARSYRLEALVDG
jgi:hypothetical protein